MSVSIWEAGWMLCMQVFVWMQFECVSVCMSLSVSVDLICQCECEWMSLWRKVSVVSVIISVNTLVCQCKCKHDCQYECISVSECQYDCQYECMSLSGNLNTCLCRSGPVWVWVLSGINVLVWVYMPLCLRVLVWVNVCQCECHYECKSEGQC